MKTFKIGQRVKIKIIITTSCPSYRYVDSKSLLNDMIFTIKFYEGQTQQSCENYFLKEIEVGPKLKSIKSLTYVEFQNEKVPEMERYQGTFTKQQLFWNSLENETNCHVS